MTATTLDPVTALVVIDLQKAVLEYPYAHSITAVAANAGRLAEAFRAQGLPIFFTKVVGKSPLAAARVDQPFTAQTGARSPDWAELVDDLGTRSGDHVVIKCRWGAFVDTTLEARLRQLGATQIVLAGVATGFGVESTARQASELGFQLTLAIDAMTDMDAEVHANSVHRIFPRLGECSSTDAIIGLLGS